MVVSYIYGYRENGEPIFTRGDWVEFTVSKDGKMKDNVPSA